MKFTYLAVMLTAASIAVAVPVDNSSSEETWLGDNRDKILHLFAKRPDDQRTNDYALAGDDAIQLGKQLFFDKRLSRVGKLSCASCHQPDRFWTDGRKVAEGEGPLAFNTPTLIGVHRLKWLFWDGRAIGLAHQALHPMTNPLEMGGEATHILKLINDVDQYRSGYRRHFGDLPGATCVADKTPACVDGLKDVQFNTARLIATFVAAIPSPVTPFDRFSAELLASPKAPSFSPQQVRGLRLFVEKGNCVACHSGSDLTDGQFHNVLVPENDGASIFSGGRYSSLREASTVQQYSRKDKFSDFARAEFQRARADSSLFGAFKTPTLRGLRCTSPYMHNGRFAQLEDVIEHYSSFTGVIRPQHHDDPLVRPRSFTQTEKDDLISFLLTLSPESGACL